MRFLAPGWPLTIIRVIVCLVIFSHGAARIYLQSLAGFGDFLGSRGFPFGSYLAWVITLFEIIFSLLGIFRIWIKIFCLGEIFILIMGIILVHWPNGWFVVGAANGGIEYSVVLVSCLLAIYLGERNNP